MSPFDIDPPASFSNPPDSSALSFFGVSRPQDGEGPQAPLGKLAKSVNAPTEKPPVNHEKRRWNRSEAYRLQRSSAHILRRERVARCFWSLTDLSSTVQIVRSQDGRATYQGLQTCGSVWHCPKCSSQVSETRRQELNRALQNARAAGLVPVLVTLTFRHALGDSLVELLDGMKAAKQHFHNSRTYKGWKHVIAGVITATEVTHGENGWHPHLHLLMFLRLPVDQTGTLADDLRTQWLASLETNGHDGNDSAFDFQAGDAAGQYVAKWGAAEELTLSSKKKTSATAAAKTGGLHPFELLKDSEFNPRSRALFFEYAMAFKGRRQLQWTPGLRDMLGVVEVPDEEAAGDAQEDEIRDFLGCFDRDEWPSVRRKGRSQILDLVETFDPGCEVIEGTCTSLEDEIHAFLATSPDIET